MATTLTPAVTGSNPTYATAKFGQGLSVSFSNEAPLAVGGNFGITTSSPWTIEGWLNTSATATQVIMGYVAGSWVGTSSGFLTSSFGPTGSHTVADGLWHHFAFAADGTTVRQFVDGVLDGTASSTSTVWPSDGSAGAGLGGFLGSTSYGFVGSLDEVRVSNTARYTAAFTAPTGVFTTDSNTVGLYHLDGDGSDASRSGNDACPGGGVLFGAGRFGAALYPLVHGGFTTTQSFGTSAYPVTIEYWAKWSGNPGTRVGFGNGAGVWCGSQGSTAHSELFGTNFSGTRNINDGAWHHLAWTYDGTIVKQWVDGLLDGSQASTSATMPWSAGTSGFGQYGGSAQFNWAGGLDDFRISNAVLYTGTFTPSSSPLSYDPATTAGLFHLNGDGTADSTAPVAGGPGSLSGSGILTAARVLSANSTPLAALPRLLATSGGTVTAHADPAARYAFASPGGFSTPLAALPRLFARSAISANTRVFSGGGTLGTSAASTLTTTGTVGINAQATGTAVAAGNATSALSGSGALAATGQAAQNPVGAVTENVRLGSDVESVFPTGVFRSASFDGGSDSPFVATAGAIAYDPAYAYPGAMGGYTPSTNSGLAASGLTTSYVSWAPTGSHDDSRKSASFYFNLSAIPDAPLSILQLGNVASVIVRTDGTIGFNSPRLSTPVPEFWSTVPLTPNTWYFLQFAATNTGTGNDRGELRVYGLANLNAATLVLEVDQAGLDFGVPPAPAAWYFGRAGTTSFPVSVFLDYLYATDIYRSIDFPGIDSTVNSVSGFGGHGSSYYQDFNNMSAGTGIVTGNPGSGASLPFASPAPNSATAETDESDYFVYTSGDVAATLDSPWEGSVAARMSLHPDGRGAAVGWLTLSSFGDSWGDRGATFAAFRLDALATYTSDYYRDEFVSLTGLLAGTLVLQPRTGCLAYENLAVGSATENGTAIVSPPLEVGAWYVLRYATNFHIDGVNLRETLEVRRADTGDIFHHVDTGIYQISAGSVYQNIVSYGVGNGHWASDWSMTWDQLILRQQWAGAGYPGPLYPAFVSNDTAAVLTVNASITSATEADTGVSAVSVNVGISAEVDSSPVVLDDTEYIPQPYGTVRGYIDGITINGASASFTMSTEFTQYATGDLSIPPVTSGSPYGAVDLCWQLAGNMRGLISEGNYWSLQGHEAGFDLKSKKLLTGRDESRYKLFHETFDKDGIPQGGVYRNWKVVDSYTSSGWYAWVGDGIYSTAGKGSSPTVKVGTRTNLICTARPGTKSVQFNFGTNLTDSGFGPHNASFALGKWFAVTISTGAVLLEGQWGEAGKTVATDFSKTASLTGLSITDTDSVRVLIGIEWVSATRMDLTVIVANASGTVTVSQSMTNTALDLFARQWSHVGAIRGLYQHTVARDKMTLASFATKPYEGAVPVDVRLPSLGIDIGAQILGTTGSLWDYLTQIAIARQVDIRNQDGTILLTPMTDVAKQAYFWEPVITPSFALGVENVAQTVEIVQNIATWKPLGTLYDSRKATDSFSVGSGQTAVFSITVSASPSLLYNPAPVGGTSTLNPNADALRDINEFRDESKHIFGAYTIQGTLDGIANHTVPAQEWIAYGGSVTVAPVDQNTIQMTVVAPIMPGWTGDFQLGLHADQDYPLVRLVGDGTKLKTKTLQFHTGANPSNTVVASQITNVAATTRRIVNTLVARASTVADGPSIALSATISMAEVRSWGLSLGTIPGSTLLYRNIQWRVLSATVQNASVQVEARPYTTYKSDYWHHNWDGASYFDFKTYWSGKKWDDFKVMPLAGPNADFHYRGPLPKFTLYPAPDANEFTPLLEPADDLLPSRDLLPSGGFSDPGTPPPYPSADLWPGAEIDPNGN